MEIEMTPKAQAGLVLVDPHDQNAVRNIDNVLTLYQMMINETKAVEGTARFLTLDYIQHNPLIADGSAALGKYFSDVKAGHPSAHVVAHRIIAVGDYVFAHVNFVNLLTDDPNDRGWPASISIRWTPTEGPSNIGIPYSSCGIRRIRPRGSPPTSKAPIRTACSESTVAARRQSPPASWGSVRRNGEFGPFCWRV
jgi:predicted SnoaL-like aldol condensation-catalyzing enzyme